MLEIENKLFRLSQKAVDGGAKIVFWSEGNCPYFEDHELEFLEKAKEFATNNSIYFAPAVLKLNYNTELGNNKVIMINPAGNIEFEYEKTISWYPTESDGIIDYIETPYGRLATTICFDNDFPDFLRQAGKNKVDILLVPAFDSVIIKEFHGQTALFRGVENGMSVVRQANKGISYSVDYLGNIVAVQDFFDTQERLMFSDLPIKGTTTLYSYMGDWLVYVNFVFFALIVIEVGYTSIKKQCLFRLKLRK